MFEKKRRSVGKKMACGTDGKFSYLLKFAFVLCVVVSAAGLPQFKDVPHNTLLYKGLDKDGNHVNYYYDEKRGCIHCEDCKGNHHSFFIPEVELVNPAKDLKYLAQKIHQAGVRSVEKVKAVMASWAEAMTNYRIYVQTKLKECAKKIKQTAVKAHEKMQSPFYKQSCRCKCHEWNENHVHGPQCQLSAYSPDGDYHYKLPK